MAQAGPALVGIETLGLVSTRFFRRSASSTAHSAGGFTHLLRSTILRSAFTTVIRTGLGSFIIHTGMASHLRGEVAAELSIQDRARSNGDVTMIGELCTLQEMRNV